MHDEPPIPIDEQLSVEEGIAVLKGPLGEYELGIANQYCCPLAWRESKGSKPIVNRNGTAFFLDTGERIFGVTAGHVFAGYLESNADRKGPLTLTSNGKSVELDLATRVIDSHPEIDIATFAVTEDEVKRLDRWKLTGGQKTWPPGLPALRCGVTYCGFPAIGTREEPGFLSYGALRASGIATQVSQTIISSQMERDFLIASTVAERGTPPENFDFGGISGGPMLTLVQYRGTRYWMLGGVIYQGPSTIDDPNQSIAGLEVIHARPAHFIMPDGRLDKDRWAQLNW
jgi:hypothetical protein